MLTLRTSQERGYADHGWLKSFHSFSFAGYYDPKHMGWGNLRVINEDRIAPGTGFGTHGHRDMEIVTWVLAGRLEHKDSEGNHGVLYPGLAQRMSAGSGIRHSEYNASPDEPVHFLQMWVPPDTAGIAPGYEQRDLNDALAAGGLVPIASGQGHDGAIAIHQRGAVLWGARLQPDEVVVLPTAPHVHLFVALGSGGLAGVGDLGTGDAVRMTAMSGVAAPRFTAGPEGAELSVWATE